MSSLSTSVRARIAPLVRLRFQRLALTSCIYYFLLDVCLKFLLFFFRGKISQIPKFCDFFCAVSYNAGCFI